ncbi:MAG: hypothetical protein LBL82_02910 [Oscillospiraceae bacterium]|jgi:hypothetical protein|nr:hypothetical protein [Oscillospiraceae bacterium]
MNKLTGLKLRARSEKETAICSSLLRELLKKLIEEHGVTYSRILFPYADRRNIFVSELLSESSIFGTHALFSGVDKEVLSSLLLTLCGEDGECVQYELCEIERSSEALSDFLQNQPNEMTSAEEYIAVGDFSKLIYGSVSDYSIRDFSKRLLAFSETLRIKNLALPIGFIGRSYIVKMSNPDIGEKEINELYLSKIDSVL